MVKNNNYRAKNLTAQTRSKILKSTLESQKLKHKFPKKNRNKKQSNKNQKI